MRQNYDDIQLPPCVAFLLIITLCSVLIPGLVLSFSVIVCCGIFATIIFLVGCFCQFICTIIDSCLKTPDTPSRNRRATTWNSLGDDLPPSYDSLF